MGDLKVEFSKLAGDIVLPPSKSVAHRALICSYLAGGKIKYVSDKKDIVLSDDIRYTEEAVIKLLSPHNSTDGTKEIFCGESGSTLRFLIPLAGALGIKTVFTGKGRLVLRPLREYDKIFDKKGVILTFPENEKTSLPLLLEGKLIPGEYFIPGDISSQYISGMLMALPLLEGDSTIKLTTALESAGYVDITLDVMKSFGVEVETSRYFTDEGVERNEYIIKGNQRYIKTEYEVEGDYSAAAFWAVANFLGNRLNLSGLREDSPQEDMRIFSILNDMRSYYEVIAGKKKKDFSRGDFSHGDFSSKDVAPENYAREVFPPEDVAPENYACEDFSSEDCLSADYPPFEIDGSRTPDIIPVLAVAASGINMKTAFVNSERLRIKESDRIKSTVDMVNSFGGNARETSEGFIVEGRDGLFEGGHVDSYGDHRIAMSAGIAGIYSKNGVIISGYECVSKSYPDFFKDLADCGGQIYELNSRE